MKTAMMKSVVRMPMEAKMTGMMPQTLQSSRCCTGSSAHVVLFELGRDPFGHWKHVNSSARI